MRLTITLLLLALAAPCNASPLLFLMQGGGVGPWPDANAINGITAISQLGPTTTGFQAGITGAGNITANATCNSFDIGLSAVVFLTVDGITADNLTCADGTTGSKTLTYAVSAGEHTIRIGGSWDDLTSFTADTFSIPLP